MTAIVLQPGKCVYWGCKNQTRSIYCKDHRPTRCRVCNCEPYGSRGLTYGLCLKHYKQWARHESSQRAKILAQDRRRSKLRTEQRRAARRAAREQKMAERWEIAWQPASEAERMEIGGWSSGACAAGAPGLYLVESRT